MALASRILSNSKQLYTIPTILPKDNVILVRHFSKKGVSNVVKKSGPRPRFGKRAGPMVPKKQTIQKGSFLDIKDKFETSIRILLQEKIQRHDKVMKAVKEKGHLVSEESQKFQQTIETRTRSIKDARTYLQTLQEIRIKRGLPDKLGGETMLFEALDKIEKELNKPLTRNDDEGMDLLLAEFDKINKKLGDNES